MTISRLSICLIVTLLLTNFASAQKTFFIRVEEDSTKLMINQQPWDGEAFFTIEREEPIYQTCVIEPGFVKFYDILHDKTNYTYAAQQRFYIDSSAIAKVKIVELNYDTEQLFAINTMDYATYKKDLMHDGQLSETIYQTSEKAVLNAITPSFIYLNQLTTDYHEETIGRYDYYSSGTIENLRVYKINLTETDWFIQVIAEVTWKFKSGDKYVGEYKHPGTSGRLAYNNDLEGTKNRMLNEITTVQDVSYENALNLAIHDAILSSFFYFLDDAQERIR